MDNGFLDGKLILKLIFEKENKLKILREYKNLSISELAAMANVSEKDIRYLESSSIELLSPKLVKIAQVLNIDEEILIDISDWLNERDIRFLNMIFHQAKLPSELERQIICWINIALYHSRQTWKNRQQNSIDVLCKLEQKEKARQYRKIRDNKYEKFRHYFKDCQKKKYLETQKKGKQLSGSGFAFWFLENIPKDIVIPYAKQNQLNQLTKHARANNREFRKIYG